MQLDRPAPDPAVVLGVRGLEHAFADAGGTRPVLHGIDLELRSGEVVVLDGPSGSGKSTLLTLIASLRTVQRGSVVLFGKELFGASADVRRSVRSGIGFIFQAHNLLPCLDARGNVLMGLALHAHMTTAERRRRADEALAAVGLGDRCDAMPDRLSGGQRQRVAIARALAPQPRLVLADEPTASLDARTGQAVVDELVRRSRDEGTAVLLVTHDERVKERADRRVALVDGRIAASHPT
jgi:putative ABC transport system ATP-binding protein